MIIDRQREEWDKRKFRGEYRRANDTIFECEKILMIIVAFIYSLSNIDRYQREKTRERTSERERRGEGGGREKSLQANPTLKIRTRSFK